MYNKNEWKSSFSGKLRKIMKEKNMNQVEVSLRTKIPQSSISKYLQGTVCPSSYNIYKLANLFDVDFNYFMEIAK